jgi:hypothetical protein
MPKGNNIAARKNADVSIGVFCVATKFKAAEERSVALSFDRIPGLEAENCLDLIFTGAVGFDRELHGKDKRLVGQCFIEDRLHTLGKEKTETSVVEIRTLKTCIPRKINHRRTTGIRFENIGLNKHFIAANVIVVRRVFCEKLDEPSFKLASAGLNGGFYVRMVANGFVVGKHVLMWIRGDITPNKNENSKAARKFRFGWLYGHGRLQLKP